VTGCVGFAWARGKKEGRVRQSVCVCVYTTRTFSLGEVLAISTSLAMSPSLVDDISMAASGEYERLQSEKSVW